MHSTAMTTVSIILVMLLVFGICGAAIDIARKWVRNIVRAEMEKAIRNAIRELRGE